MATKYIYKNIQTINCDHKVTGGEKITTKKTTTVYKNGQKTSTLKTVIPATVVQKIQLKNKDKLIWIIKENGVSIEKKE